MKLDSIKDTKQLDLQKPTSYQLPVAAKKLTVIIYLVIDTSGTDWERFKKLLIPNVFQTIQAKLTVPSFMIEIQPIVVFQSVCTPIKQFKPELLFATQENKLTEQLLAINQSLYAMKDAPDMAICILCTNNFLKVHEEDWLNLYLRYY